MGNIKRINHQDRYDVNRTFNETVQLPAQNTQSKQFTLAFKVVDRGPTDISPGDELEVAVTENNNGQTQSKGIITYVMETVNGSRGYSRRWPTGNVGTESSTLSSDVNIDSILAEADTILQRKADTKL